MTIAQQIEKLIQSAVESASFASDLPEDFQATVEYPRDKSHGDYATNTAMRLAKNLGKPPRDVAQEIIDHLPENELIESSEIAGPGFINFSITSQSLIDLIAATSSQSDNLGNSDLLKGKKIMVEFAHPNTHKAFHIGHLRNICLGESLVRIFESQGAKVIRANYQGDVGPHVAKCLWGMMNHSDASLQVTSAQQAKEFETTHLKTPQSKVEYLGQTYAAGAKAFKADVTVEAEIRKINKQVYAKDPAIMPLWEVTRQWSLDYFEYIYAKLDSHFERLYFESEMYERGVEIVKANIGKIFTKSQDAIVFEGEEYGLHTRVFITKEGNATYEGKEMANVEMQYNEYSFDEIIHITANEQSGYFDVVFKAAELINPNLEGKQHHISYGMVNLSSGKMSSRTGDVITAESLIDEAKSRLSEFFASSDYSDSEKTEISEKVAIAAVKFTMLHADSKKDIAFDMENSLKITGSSGPYLLYGYTRINSILSKVGDIDTEPDYSNFNSYDWALAKKISRFSEEITRSCQDNTTHNLANYLLEVVADFSRWYENNRVLESEQSLKSARVELLKGIAKIIKKGADLLGINVVEKM